MFWASLLAGAAVLLQWKIWVALLLYVIANWIVLSVGAGLFSAAESGSGKAGGAGCIFMFIVHPLLQGVLISFFIVFMLPVMLGSSSTTGLSDVASMVWPVTKAGIVATVAVAVLCFIPIIGSLIAGSVGLQTFIMGAIVFRLFFAAIEDEFQMPAGQPIYPSVWNCLGYLVISAILVWLLTMLGALLSSFLEASDHDGASTGTAVMVGSLLGILGGFLPLFMYIQYVVLAVRAAQNR